MQVNAYDLCVCGGNRCDAAHRQGRSAAPPPPPHPRKKEPRDLPGAEFEEERASRRLNEKGLGKCPGRRGVEWQNR